MYAWLAMWVSAVLLPCSEVAAAMAAHEQATAPSCGQSGTGKSHDGGKRHKPCSSVSAPTQTSTARPASTGGHPIALVALVAASSYVLSSGPGLSRPVAHRAAQPPPAAFLRNLRLLI